MSTFIKDMIHITVGLGLLIAIGVFFPLVLLVFAALVLLHKAF